MTDITKQLAEALEALLDEQNGAPLITDEVEWYEAVSKSRAALAAYHSQQSTPCDMGEICIGCEPRWEDGGCPDAQPVAMTGEQLKRLPVFAWASTKQPKAIHHQVKDLWLKVRAEQVEDYSEPLVLLADVRSALSAQAAPKVPEAKAQAVPADGFRYFFISREPGKAPRIGFPVGDMRKSVLDWLKHSPAGLDVVTWWADGGPSPGTATVQTAADWLYEDDPESIPLVGAAPQPPDPSEPELIYCKYCQGSGESTHMVGRGPDAHDEPCNCDKCGGTGVFQAGRVVDVGLLKYRGSGVAHIHARMTAYWSVLDAAWEALKNAGIRPDGNTSVAMAIERLSAPSEQRKPLTWQPIESAPEDRPFTQDEYLAQVNPSALKPLTVGFRPTELVTGVTGMFWPASSRDGSGDTDPCEAVVIEIQQSDRVALKLQDGRVVRDVLVVPEKSWQTHVFVRTPQPHAHGIHFSGSEQ